jgi:hypothetical protein
VKIENTVVAGFRSAIPAMRNPMDSWERSATTYTDFFQGNEDIRCSDFPLLCDNDKNLSTKLVKSGSEHRKFLRQIIITADITVPRYVWAEIDTYKIATVRNSCSTMHKLGHTNLEESDFQDGEVFSFVLNMLNAAGRAYREKTPFSVCAPVGQQQLILEGYDIVRWMKKHLPEGFLQKATYTMSYETALAMLRQRSSHRLPEWSGPGGICPWLRTLPYLAMWHEACQKREE